jgi:hypothetical protein
MFLYMPVKIPKIRRTECTIGENVKELEHSDTDGKNIK